MRDEKAESWLAWPAWCYSNSVPTSIKPFLEPLDPQPTVCVTSYWRHEAHFRSKIDSNLASDGEDTRSSVYIARPKHIKSPVDPRPLRRIPYQLFFPEGWPRSPGQVGSVICIASHLSLIIVKMWKFHILDRLLENFVSEFRYFLFVKFQSHVRELEGWT